MNSNSGIIIQARTGSTRLPNKIFLPFLESKNILGLLIEKLKANFDMPIILATTNNPSDDKVADFGEKSGVKVFRGSEENVLKRFIDAANFYNIITVYRVCSDNPFIDIDGITQLIKTTADVDYVGFSVNGTPTIKTHYGFWIEKVKLEALKSVQAETNEKIYLEHVTNYIYTHPEKYKIHLIPVAEEIANKNIRLTLDTIDDYNMQKELYNALILNYGKVFSITDIVHYLDSFPNYYQLMNLNISKNAK